ncbi:MAG: SpoIID/LytB domain-containing protein [Nocardioidaceae bacterium]
MRTRFPLIGLVAALVAALLLPGELASAKSVNQTYAVPKSRVLTIKGHGYGHGHGMSQYGARGAARDGLSWKKILAFYYPGTKRGTTANEIRVLISADTSPAVVIKPIAGLRVRDLTTKKTYAAPKVDARRWRLKPSGKRNLAQYKLVKKNKVTWRTWRAFAGNAEFYRTGKPLTLILPGGSTRRYRGALRAAAPTKGSAKRDTVNVLGIDEYVKGVVAAEMPASWERAAVRAQAVAARTYAAWSRTSRADKSWQICDTISCQVYGGVGSENALSNAAVDATAGVVLTYQGKPAFTQFSSSSGGWTSAGSVPYLVSKKDPYEADSGNPYTNWSTTVKAATLERSYPALGKLKRIKVTSREGGGQWQGRVWSLTLVGSKKNVVVSGDGFRSLLGLRSTWFTFG